MISERIIKIQSLILTNFGCAPQTKNSTFLVQKTASPSQLLLPNPVGEGAVFIFGANIGLKNTKNVLFCTLFRSMGEGEAVFPPLRIRYCSNIFNFGSNFYDQMSSSIFICSMLIRKLSGLKRIAYGSFKQIFWLWQKD